MDDKTRMMKVVKNIVTVSGLCMNCQKSLVYNEEDDVFECPSNHCNTEVFIQIG